MNRLISITGVAMAAGIFSMCAMAGQSQTGNGAPSGPHYNLNIIGVEENCNGNKCSRADGPPMTNSNRHTIFMPLVANKTTGRYSKDNFDETGTGVQTAIVDEKIWLVAGDSFAVCDGNGFDDAHGCPDSVWSDRWVTTAYDKDGNEIPVDERKTGAVFQLPCNTNLNGAFWDSDGDGKVEDNGDDEALDELVRCNYAVSETGEEIPLNSVEHNVVPTMKYQVWARALGKPDGEAVSTTCATVHGDLYCSLENAVFERTDGRQTFHDVTDAMTSLVIGYCQDVVVTITHEDGVDVDDYELCVIENLGSDSTDYSPSDIGDVDWTRIALFAGNTEDWFWNYDNNGLRLAQIRFYEID